MIAATPEELVEHEQQTKDDPNASHWGYCATEPWPK